MLFGYSNPAHRTDFLKSFERLMQATYPEYRLKEDWFSCPSSELTYKNLVKK